MTDENRPGLSEFETIIVIQLQRLYDLLLLNLPESTQERIEGLHTEGRYLAPEPSIAPDYQDGSK